MPAPKTTTPIKRRRRVMKTVGEQTVAPRSVVSTKDAMDFKGFDRKNFDYIRVQKQEIKTIEDSIINPCSVSAYLNQSWKIVSDDQMVTGHIGLVLMARDKAIGDRIRAEESRRANRGGNAQSSRESNAVGYTAEQQAAMRMSRDGFVERLNPVGMQQVFNSLPDDQKIANRDERLAEIVHSNTDFERGLHNAANVALE